MTWLRAFGRFFEQKIGLHRLGIILSLDHHRHRRGGALPQAAQHQRQQGADRDGDGRIPRRRDLRAVRRARLFHADVLRPVRAAHDRPQGRALPHRGARRLHLLFGRPQCRRQRLHRRRGALPHLFGLGARRHRGRQDLLHRRSHLLARQRHGAGLRLCLSSAGRLRHRPASALAEPRARHRGAHDPGRLHRLGVAHAARHRTAELAGAAAERAADAVADRHRHRRSVAAARWRCTCWCRTSRTCSSSTSR